VIARPSFRLPIALSRAILPMLPSCLAVIMEVPLSFARAAFASFLTASLAGCAAPAHTVTVAKSDCTDSYTGSRLCDADNGPDTGDAFHNPSVGLDQPFHPH
jgi:hypothetical protein